MVKLPNHGKICCGHCERSVFLLREAIQVSDRMSRIMVIHSQPLVAHPDRHDPQNNAGLAIDGVKFRRVVRVKLPDYGKIVDGVQKVI